MRKSKNVAAPLLAAAALSMMSGCRKPEMQRCVDENNVVVDDSLCANQPQTNQQYQNMGGGGGGYVPYRPMYHYYYGGSGGFGLGTPVSGGSVDPVEGHTYADSSGRTSSVRGGFGRTMSSGGDSGGHGGGAGE
ncbi:MAG TPA: hypothetical protein VF214_03620 [Edaphobacter sp.]